MTSDDDMWTLIERVERLERRVKALEIRPPAFVPPPVYGPTEPQMKIAPELTERLMFEQTATTVEHLSDRLDALRAESAKDRADLDAIADLLPPSDLDIVARVRLALDEADYYRDALADLHPARMGRPPLRPVTGADWDRTPPIDPLECATIIGAADYPALGITDAIPAKDVLAALLAESPQDAPQSTPEPVERFGYELDGRGNLKAVYRLQDAPQSTRAETLPETRERAADGLCLACGRPRGAERWICAECANR